VPYRRGKARERIRSCFHEKFYPVSTQLRVEKEQNRETVCAEVFRNGRSRRHCCLFSIDAQFPKLDVAGSIPVSRSFSFIKLQSFIINNSSKPSF
jgi:hypothetical protein